MKNLVTLKCLHIICFLLILVKNVFSGEDFVLDGVRASPSQFPFIARIVDRDRDNICTGSLIDGNKVLTAAHCFWHDSGKPKRNACGSVVFNDRDTKNKNGKGTRREEWQKIKKIKRYSYDLAEVTLSEEVHFKPVTLSTKTVKKGDKVKGVGYGRKRHGKPNRYLQQIDLKVTELESGYEIATGVGRNGKSMCVGDSGGPLLVKKNGDWELLATLIGGGYDCENDRPDDPNEYWNVVDDYHNHKKSRRGKIKCV